MLLSIKNIPFRIAVIIPAALVGVLTVSMIVGFFSYQSHQQTALAAQIVQDEKTNRVSIDLNTKIWQARLAVLNSVAKLRDLNAAKNAEEALTTMVQAADLYQPETDTGNNLKRLINDYQKAALVMLKYHYTIDDEVRYGVTGSGAKFDDYLVYISSAQFSNEYRNTLVDAMTDIAKTRIYFNSFQVGLRVSELDKAISMISSALKKLTPYSRYDKRTEDIVALATRYETALKNIHNGIKAHSQADKDTDALGAEINQNLVLMSQVIGQRGYQVAEKNQEQQQNMSLLNLVLVTLFSLFGITLAWVLSSQLTQQLKQLLTTAHKISNKNLAEPHIDTSRNEIGMLAREIEQMRLNLHHIIADIALSTSQLSSAAEEVSAVSLQSNGGMQNQQDQLGQLATAMNQMQSTANDMSRNAEEAANAVKNAASEAESGRNIIKATIETIEQVSIDVQQAGQVVHELEQESSRIGVVIDVIRGIADQTNLLALNAAIEAARAGEQGRGFAVVADEVRTLAHRTQESTSEINGIIENLQQKANAAERAMVTSSTRMNNGVTQVQNSGNIINRMSENILLINDMNTQIASATEEQNAVSEGLNININNINDVTIEIVEGSTQTTRACEELSALANNLQKLTQQFSI
ncbi:methyl-accepting chemotaxis protein [Plesiomonas sp.]|uniref:methyl-accepting chemotaxis protein n=1 Tax=Plesiomonas sp. TaxID=2486279 RepID=UPI003F3C496E